MDENNISKIILLNKNETTDLTATIVIRMNRTYCKNMTKGDSVPKK